MSAADTRPPLPMRPTPHERDGRQGSPEPGRPHSSRLTRRARVLLVAALSVVVSMAFAVSWTALRDVATAIGIPPAAATLYPFVVDGLMALALVATLVLDGSARKTALRVLAAYTAASLTLNYVHGLVPGLHDLEPGQRVRLAGVDWAHWLLVGLAAALPVGAIYFGSDLVARVLHHRPESAPAAAAQSTPDVRESTPTGPAQSTPTHGPEPVPVDPDRESALEEESTPTEPTTRPRPKSRPRTGPVPTAARSTAPRRTFEELLTEARALSTGDQESAERIRTELRVGSGRARQLRDLLAAERDQAAAVPLHAVSGTEERRALVAVDNSPEEQPAAAAGGAR
jgi:hypothetical protein